MNYFLNGVNGVTGEYLTPPESAESLRARIETAAENVASFKLRTAKRRGTLGLPFDVDPKSIADAGWALVVPRDDEASLRDALAPLIAHRQEQAGARAKVLTYGGESRGQWLASHHVAAGDIDPDKVPFYLLFAGDAAKIPFGFVHEIAVEYAVGRIEFDSADDYRRYAENVKRYETGGAPTTTRRASFFGARHEFDGATQLSADHLVTPLADTTNEKNAVRKARFEATCDIGPAATRARLGALLREKPSFLFTASHGVGWPAGHEDQRRNQGALLCQDWPAVGKVRREHYFAADDVADDADLSGMVTFHFACYGAGTPLEDRFPAARNAPPPHISASPFVASLPKRLLLQGALASAGHVERAWGYSIAPNDPDEEQIGPFRNFIGRVLTGEPVGHAMRDFASRHAVLAVALANVLERGEYMRVAPETMAELWMQRNDAESYLVVGDPAVRLRHTEIKP